MNYRISHIFLSAALMLPCFAVSTTATAETTEERSEESIQKAAEYYQEAAELYVDGQFDRAAELLDLAFSHDPDLIYRYNQILSYQGLGDYERALEMLAEYEEAMKEDERFDDIGEIRGELESAIAAIEEEEAARRAEREEKEGLEAIGLPPGDKKEEESSNTLGWALVGTGGATVAGGLFFSSGFLVRDRIDRLEQTRTPTDAQEIYGDSPYNRLDDLDTIRTHQQLTIAFLAGGVVLTSAGSFLLWRNRGEDTAPANASSLHLQPSIGADGAGAQIIGRF